MVNQFGNSLNRLKSALDKSETFNVDINKRVDFSKSIYDYKERRLASYKNLVEGSLKDLSKYKERLSKLVMYSKENESNVFKIFNLVDELERNYIEGRVDLMKKNTEKLSLLFKSLDVPLSKKRFKFNLSKLPVNIREEVKVDLEELEKCFENECYRSVVSLCGRILETALHSKYYEVSGVNILENNPGIGLGKLIAKLDEKGVKFDPGLSQQIHLINQVRVFSIHKKEDVFYPSRAQAEAVILFTLDIIEKLF